MSDKVFFNTESIQGRLLERYPFGYIPRTELSKATGGLLHPKTLANRECKAGEKISGAVKIGGKVCYPIEDVISYLKTNITDLNKPAKDQ